MSDTFLAWVTRAANQVLARHADSVEAMLVLAVQNLTDGETQLLDDAIAILQRLQRSLERQLVLSRVMQPGMSSFAANLKPRSNVDSPKLPEAHHLLAQVAFWLLLRRSCQI